LTAILDSFFVDTEVSTKTGQVQDRIVAADADAKNETKADEPPNIGREGAGDCSRSENQHFETVNSLAAEHVRDSTKKQRTNGCGKQSRGLD
jgi:hypothetical protein